MIYQYHLSTGRQGMYNIHKELSDAVEASGVKEGRALIFCPHTTGAVTINENADPDVTKDLLYAFDHFFPDLENYRHMEGNSRAHLLSTLVGCEQSVIISGGRPLLGIWQSPYFLEFDGPRNRTFYIQVTEG